jgi:DNA-binding response OmpR family regulator
MTSVWWMSRPAPKHVLIVDDDFALARLGSVILRAQGFDVHVVNNGDDAIAYAQATPPDAIALDLRMPGKDGRQVFRELRALGLNIPVLIVSAYDARQAQEELGAQAYLNKPFEPERLASAVRALLQDEVNSRF